MASRSYTHLINPINPPVESDLVVAQPITLESMRMAKAYGEEHGLVIDHCAVVYEEDKNQAPIAFDSVKILTRSVQDVADFDTNRKLPLIKDIFDCGCADSAAEFVIYTNLDISLLPHFYTAVDRLLDQGHRALIINRRTISGQWTDVNDLSLMFAEIGIAHDGFDCFVFPRSWVRELDFGNVCIGAPFIGLVVALAITGMTDKWMLVEKEHLTFHIGDDRAWDSGNLNAYAQHNKLETAGVIERYESEHGTIRWDTAPTWSFGALAQIKVDELGFPPSILPRGPKLKKRLVSKLRKIRDLLS
ncbi:MAG: hypothetical protein AAF541_21360 [Pseudomonadota bacterium]